MGVLDGKVAIVTGSARGIGRATAEILSEHGASVEVNDLDGDVAEQTASEIDGDTLVFAGDLTKEGVPDQLVGKVIDEWGKVVKVDGWYEREAAMKVLEDSRKRWEDGQKAD